MKVYLINQGGEAAQIGTITASAPFAIVGGEDHCSDRTIEPKKECTLLVEFEPEATGRFTSSLNVPYNGSAPSETLEGNGVAVTLHAPKMAKFPKQAAGTISKPKNITISNHSKVQVTLGAATIGGSNATAFQIVSDGCSGQTLQSKGKCAVTVEFAPSTQSADAQTASLNLGFSYGSNWGDVSVSFATSP